MSRHDYTTHSKKNQNEVNEAHEELKTETMIEEPVEDGDTNETATEAKPAEEPKSYDLGIVTGCDKLRVRSEPRFGTNVVCEIERGTKVMIDKSESTVDYYKIFTESGIEGFCVKTYIA